MVDASFERPANTPDILWEKNHRIESENEN
jgi:hypothetical protein